MILVLPTEASPINTIFSIYININKIYNMKLHKYKCI